MTIPRKAPPDHECSLIAVCTARGSPTATQRTCCANATAYARKVCRQRCRISGSYGRCFTRQQITISQRFFAVQEKRPGQPNPWIAPAERRRRRSVGLAAQERRDVQQVLLQPQIADAVADGTLALHRRLLELAVVRLGAGGTGAAHHPHGR